MSSIADTGYLGYLGIAHTQNCAYTKKTSIASVSMDTSASMRRPDLKRTDGTIITCQNRAWIDSAGMAMMADVLLGPNLRLAGKRMVMVWDNCGPHKVESVREVYASWGIKCLELPPKMTDILQVMDLVVNGPLKAAIRRSRTSNLFDYFQQWKVKRMTASLNKTPLPDFAPPKPKLSDGLQALLECAATTFTTPEFAKPMQSTFVKVGLKRQGDKLVCYTAA